MDIKSLLKEARQKPLKPTATVVRYSNGKICIDKKELLSDQERERRVSASEEAGKIRNESSSSTPDASERIEIAASEKHLKINAIQDEHTKQLVALGLAMGGPRFPNFNLRPHQKDDDLESFEPLLREYLHVAGQTVNDTASFQDYFGQDIGLDQWSLLMVAASVWVNAPRCMKLLLDLGADPLQKDSSGRHVLMESLSTARHGKFGPWNVLQSLAKDQSHSLITKSHLTEAKLCDITESMIVALRQGKMSITPLATRYDFLKIWNHGFRVHNRHYLPNEIQQHFYEIILIRFDDLESLPRLPARHEATRWTFGQVMDLERRDQIKILFMSHRWLRPHMGHPDDEDDSKFAAFVEIGNQYCQQKQMDKSDLFFWIDYSCIDQSVPSIKTRSIQSLPFYILISDGFVGIEHEDYMTRAWCMLEILFGSSMPVKTEGFDFFRYLTNPQALEVQNQSFQETDPRLGGVTDSNDMHYIRSLTWFAEKLYKWL